MSIDPVTFGQTGDPRYFNRYAYAANDPVNKIDFDGRQFADVNHAILAEMRAGATIDEARASVNAQDENGQKAAVFGATLIPIGRGTQIGGGIGARALAAAALRRGASKSFSGAGKFVTKTIGQATKTGGRSGRNTSQVFSNGGQKSANKLFGTLTKGGKTKTNPNGSLQGTLKDGSSVNLSTNSKGITSVRIRQSRPDTGTRIRKEIKVRFKEDQ